MVLVSNSFLPYLESIKLEYIMNNTRAFFYIIMNAQILYGCFVMKSFVFWKWEPIIFAKKLIFQVAFKKMECFFNKITKNHMTKEPGGTQSYDFLKLRSLSFPLMVIGTVLVLCLFSNN